MAERFFTGLDGALLLDGTQVAKVQSWSFSSEIETLDTTTTGSSAKKYMFGRVGWSGSCNVLYYQDSAGALAMAALLDSTFTASPIDKLEQYTMKFEIAPTRAVEMSVLITGASIEVAAGEIISANISFIVSDYLSNISLGSDA